LEQISPKARVARGATYLFIQGFLNALLGVIYVIVLYRTLGDEHPEELGIFALIFFILSLPQVFGTFALQSVAGKYIPQYISEDSLDKAKSVVVRILQIGALASAVSFSAIFLSAEWLSAEMLGTTYYTEILRIVALTSVFNIFYVLVSGFLQGLQKIRDLALINLAYTVAQNFVGILLLLAGWRLYAVVYGWLTGLAIASATGVILTAKYIGLSGRAHPVKPLFKFSLPLYLSGVIGFLMTWVDQLILVYYLGVVVLGIYNVAVRASVVPTIFSTSIITALFPQLSALYTKEGFSSLKDAFRVSSRYSVLVGFPLIVGLMVLSKPVVILFTGGGLYTEAILPLIIISIAALMSTLTIAAGPILLTLEKTRIVSLLSIISVILSAFLSYFTLVFLGLGMAGTAWARTIATIVGVALSLYVLNRVVPISFDKEALWKASVASLLMVFTILALDFARMVVSTASYGFLEIQLRLFPIYLISAGLVYIISIIALIAIKKRDIELVEEYLPRKFKRVAAWLERFAANE